MSYHDQKLIKENNDCKHLNMKKHDVRVHGMIVGSTEYCNDCGKIKEEWFGDHVVYQNWKEV